MTVVSLAEELGLWSKIEAVLRNRLGSGQVIAIVDQFNRLPVKRSHAVQRLGSYITKGSEPLAIRLQFAQEPEQLRLTFLHEIAHACDHLTHQSGRHYRRAHGPGWKNWMTAFDVPAERIGQSEALVALREQRLRVVAVCRTCGAEIKRLRRFDRRKRYIHTECGGRLVPV